MNGKGAVKPGALSKPELDDGHSGAPEGTAVHRGGTPAPILYAVPALALTVLIVARHFEIVARKPIWAYGIAIVGSTVVSQWLDRWSDAPRGSWRLHVRVGFHAATVMSVIYLTGWGPALGLCFVYTALVDLQQSGAASWRAVLGWSLVCCAIGQVLVYEAVMPSFLNHTAAQSLGFLGAVAFSIVIVMAGAIGEAKDRTDGLLARTRDEALRREAHHRAVVENAAEGIIAINAEGSFLSFNAAAEAMFGWTAEEIVGRPAATIMPLERHDAVERFLGDCRSSPSPVVKANVETEGTRRDGTRFPMMLSASLIAGDNGEWIILGIIRDLSDQKRFEAQLAYQALHDPLTGLPNRIMLTDRLSQALVRVRRHQRMCGVLYVDLDRFKGVNDTLGHAVGDQLLIEAAARIRGAVRESDTVARLGGDEFVVLCEEIEGVHHATEMARRVISVFESPFLVGDDDPSVGASVGIAFSGDGTESADTIFTNADIAMYRAKEKGRNRYELFDETMQQWVVTQIALETALRQAMPRNELRLFCQPVVETSRGVVVGFEALVRWDRPGFGLVPPNTFIPSAEETGLIVEIGAWVLEQACRHAAAWTRRWPDRRLGISVNVSSRQLVCGDIVGVVDSALSRSGLDPTLLTLELTESTLIDDAITVEPFLKELRALGANLALDDFGTGYSSLTYLRAFPINVVKIDKSFIEMIGTERGDTAIVSAVIRMAKDLGLTVVAEGVETPEQLTLLRQLSCRFAQGYLFARPRPVSQITGLVETPILNLGARTPELRP